MYSYLLDSGEGEDKHHAEAIPVAEDMEELPLDPDTVLDGLDPGEGRRFDHL